MDKMNAEEKGDSWLNVPCVRPAVVRSCMMQMESALDRSHDSSTTVSSARASNVYTYMYIV